MSNSVSVASYHGLDHPFTEDGGRLRSSAQKPLPLDWQIAEACRRHRCSARTGEFLTVVRTRAGRALGRPPTWTTSLAAWPLLVAA